MPPETYLFGLFAGLVALAVWKAWKQSLQRKQSLQGNQSLEGKLKDDYAFWVPDGDPDMAEAMRKARSTLPEFLRLAEAPRPEASLFSVKVGIPAKGAVEYFWIIPFTRENGRFSGKIENDSEIADSVKLGDTITFDEEQIVDWSYIENGQLKGNYTLYALLKREPREEAEALVARYGMDCQL